MLVHCTHLGTCLFNLYFYARLSAECWGNEAAISMGKTCNQINKLKCGLISGSGKRYKGKTKNKLVSGSGK